MPHVGERLDGVLLVDAREGRGEVGEAVDHHTQHRGAHIVAGEGRQKCHDRAHDDDEAADVLRVVEHLAQQRRREEQRDTAGSEGQGHTTRAGDTNQ